MTKSLDEIWPESRNWREIRAKVRDPLMNMLTMKSLVEDKKAFDEIFNAKTSVKRLCQIARSEEELLRYILAAMRGRRFKRARAILRQDSHPRIRYAAEID